MQQPTSRLVLTLPASNSFFPSFCFLPPPISSFIPSYISAVSNLCNFYLLSLSSYRLFLSSYLLSLSSYPLFLSSNHLFLSSNFLFLSNSLLFLFSDLLFLSSNLLFISSYLLFISSHLLFTNSNRGSKKSVQSLNFSIDELIQK